MPHSGTGVLIICSVPVTGENLHQFGHLEGPGGTIFEQWERRVPNVDGMLGYYYRWSPELRSRDQEENKELEEEFFSRAG